MKLFHGTSKCDNVERIDNVCTENIFRKAELPKFRVDLVQGLFSEVL
jgi:hypothetical protein